MERKMTERIKKLHKMILERWPERDKRGRPKLMRVIPRDDNFWGHKGFGWAFDPTRRACVSPLLAAEQADIYDDGELTDEEIVDEIMSQLEL